MIDKGHKVVQKFRPKTNAYGPPQYLTENLRLTDDCLQFGVSWKGFGGFVGLFRLMLAKSEELMKEL